MLISVYFNKCEDTLKNKLITWNEIVGYVPFLPVQLQVLDLSNNIIQLLDLSQQLLWLHPFSLNLKETQLFGEDPDASLKTTSTCTAFMNFVEIIGLEDRRGLIYLLTNYLCIFMLADLHFLIA
ncbi:hypothetical protein ACJX0J_015485, partial [Zea mays]